MLSSFAPPATNDTALRVAAIHERVTIFDIFVRMGIDLVPETQQMRCPFHADRSPSARVYAEQNKLYCFTCQKSWDVIAVVQDHFRLPFREALTWLEGEFGIGDVLPTLAGGLRTILLKRPPPAVAAIAADLEAMLKARRDALGFVRYTQALQALDLTVYQARTLTGAQLRARLDAIQQATTC